MNISLFTDWMEERLFGEDEFAHLIADIIDEAMAHAEEREGKGDGAVEQALLHSAWAAAAEKDEAIRSRTAVVLARLGYPDAGAYLERVIDCGDTLVARAAAIVLAGLRGVDARLLETLKETIADGSESREVRSSAAQAMAQANTPEATQALIQAAQSEDPELAQYGVEGLGVTRLPAASADREPAFAAMVKALLRKDPHLQSAAVEALGNFGDPAAIPHLERILIEKDAFLRRKALVALARLGAPSARAPLARMVKDPSVPGRGEIVDLIAECYGESMAKDLDPVACDPDSELRHHVATALGKMDGPASLALLRRIAKEDTDPFVQEQAETAIARREAATAEPAVPAAAETSPKHREPPPAPAEDAEHTPGGLKPLHTEPAAQARGPGNVIESTLESMECSWSRDAQGYHVQIPVAPGQQKVSIFLGETDYESSPIYRFAVDCGPVEPAAFETALRNNAVLDYGALAIMNVSGRPSFVLTDTMLADSAKVADIRKRLISLARVAAQLRG